MNQLDHYAISRILGSTIQPYARSGFGGFSAVRAVGEMLASRPKPPAKLSPDAVRDASIVKAFEQSHEGYSIDRTFADPALACRFIEAARRLGVDASQAAISRRLFRLRKAGGLSGMTTKEDNRDLRPFLIPAELAFVQLSYRFNASEDDLLIDPEIGAAFDELARKIGCGMGSVVDYRLAALHLRKNIRNREANVVKQAEKISVADLSKRWHDLGPLASITPASVPTGEGILSLSEPSRFLFVTKHASLRTGIELFQQDDLLAAIGNKFWTPSPERISLGVVWPDDVKDTTLRAVEFRSLEVYRPIFNMLPTAA